ncbi:alpha/beta hydrolase [Pontibacter sp. 172403-2]|uniref:alpha/beta fold hydrolase n=1 Tax=Pontibacter rufus TaxID=2791028 RepID=UPI0018AF92C9|nr:alpha/beta hydrolase [Pontibacter sp. 172403-2]MBF9254325.1 alpha/beta hydrolase [Pontibacter sp. 172403-2]
MAIQEKTYVVNGITLHVAEAGEQTGKVILFLHGFPEFWYGWRKQLTYFAGKGFRAVAPDQRGYNRSSKPAGVKAYTMEKLTDDIAALIRQLTQESVYLVGHDWGGAVAWVMAIRYPDLLEKLIILNMPHPQVMKENLKHNPKQMLKSWYAGFFQLPFLPELAGSIFDYKLLEHSMKSSAKKGTFSDADMAHYKAAWQQPKALASMLNWYRAYKYNRLNLAGDITVPTLLIWGRKDTFLGQEMAQPSIARCKNGQLVFIDNATHWLHHEKPDEVNHLIEAFINQP